MARPRQRQAPAPQRLILDSGAVIALARGEQRARAFLARALELGAVIEIPAVVVAETIRGGPRDAPVQRVLKAIGRVPSATEKLARIAGGLLGQTKLAAAVDALVVAHAIDAGGAHMLTGDREDLERLAGANPEVWVQPLA